MSQRWLEISVHVDPSDVDDLRAELGRYVGSALAIEHPADDAAGRVTVRAYIADGEECASTREAVERALWHLGATGASTLREPQTRWVRPEEYSQRVARVLPPVPLGQGFIVAPSWSDAPDTARRVIRLDPGMAFGTGLHPTTQLAVEMLERALRPGQDAIDVGTGSGILAIVAALRGARRVSAIDSDVNAARAARENVERNGCEDRVAVIQWQLPVCAWIRATCWWPTSWRTAFAEPRHYLRAVRRGGR